MNNNSHLIAYPKIKDRPSDRSIANFQANHAIGDPVILLFGTSGFIKNCRITKVHFTENNVSYDVEVKWQFDGEPKVFTNRIHNIDSIRVYSLRDFQESETIQKESNFIVRLKAHVEKAIKASGMHDILIDRIPSADREKMLTGFFELLAEGAVDALHVGESVKKYIQS